MTTASEVIGKGLHLFGILDQTEDPQPGDLTTGVPILNDMLRSEYMDAATQYLIKLVTVQLPPGVAGQDYSFVIGLGRDVPVDAVAMRAMWLNDINLTVNRETREAPLADVVRTKNPGIITRWHQRRQADGTVLVNAWQPPNRVVQALIEYGGRVAPITTPDSEVTLPPEGVHDAALLFGMTVCSAYGRAFEAVGPVAQRAMAVHNRWQAYAKGMQWLRYVRS